MQISEPMTMATDYLLAALALIFSVRSWRTGQHSGQTCIRLWSAAFFMLALGAMFGGTSHGFALHLNPQAQKILWKATVYSIGLASFFMLSGTIIASVSSFARRILLFVALAQLAAYGYWMASHDDFFFVVLDYVPAMVLIIVLQVYVLVQSRARSAPWLLAGIALSFLASGIQVSRLALHTHFNHNDLYHVVQMVATYVLYRGALLLRDRG